MKTEETNTENTEQLELQFPDPVIETLREENEALKGEIRIRSAIYDIETQLAKAQARSPKLLAEQAKASFQFDTDGKLANAAAVMDHLQKTFPEQFGTELPTGSIDGGAGRNTGPALTKEALSQMTPAQINGLDWKEVRSVLSN